MREVVLSMSLGGIKIYIIYMGKKKKKETGLMRMLFGKWDQELR